MKSRVTFYLFLLALIVLDAVLIRSPNLIGKFGLWFYKYHYLRTFPKALLTVSLVVGTSVIVMETIRFTVKKGWMKKAAAGLAFLAFTLAAVAILAKVVLDFSQGSYSHTGIRFRSGAYLLPAIMVAVFIYGWITLPRGPVAATEESIAVPTTQSNDN